MEINAAPDRLDLADTRVRAAKEAGVAFAINTDAHRPEQFAFMAYGITIARRGWLTRHEVINTLPADALLARLTDRTGQI